MKYSVLLLFVAFTSCISYKPLPLKNKYVEAPVSAETNISREAVWEKLADQLALEPTQVNLIDKASGLIVYKEKVLTYSYEDSTGALLDPSAYIAIPRQVDDHSKITWKPHYVQAGWAVRVKPGSDGKTIIAVNLLNVRTVQKRRSFLRKPKYVEGARSTGNFEQSIIAQLK